MYGPFVHGLNKGGLDSILQSRKLRASDAAQIAGGSVAVRAHVGDFQTLRMRNRWTDPAKIFIEFKTGIKPDNHPAIATWRDLPGGYLPIAITAVHDGSGARLR